MRFPTIDESAERNTPTMPETMAHVIALVADGATSAVAATA